jgi:hypothetical protein
MWMLFVIVLETDQYLVAPRGPFPTAEICELARDAVLQTAPQPKINYEAVCIQTDHNIGGA